MSEKKEKRINFLFMGFVNAPNGAATFFKTIINNRHFFELNDSIVEFYCQPLGVDLETVVDGYSVKKDSSRARVKFQNLIHKSFIFSIIGLYVFAIRHALRVVRNVNVIGVNNYWVFNDLFVAYFFMRKYPNEKNTTLILHNNGDPTKMIYQTFSKLGNGLFKNLFDRKTKKVISSMSNIVLLADNAKDVLLGKYYDLDNLDKKCLVIENGICISTFKRTVPISDKKIGVSVGSVSYRKGFDFLIEANNKLDKDSSIELVCIGNIQDEEILNLNTKSNITFLGSQNSKQIAQILSNADFFILCSRDEGMPISIIEAMQNKLPIMATDVGAINKMIDDKVTGILMKPSIDSVFDTLKDIDSGSVDLVAFGKESYIKYEKEFSVDIMLNKYIKIFTK